MNGEASNDKSSLAILLVTSQTFSVDQKEQVLSKINSSLNQIDQSQLAVNLEEELNFVTQSNPSDSFFDKEHRVQSRNANFNFELLINSTLSSFKRAVRSLLQSECKIKTLICAGIDHNINAQLVLQDSLLSCDEFSALLAEPETLQFLTAQNSSVQLNFNSKAISENSNWKHLEKLPQLQKNTAVKLVSAAVSAAAGSGGEERRLYTDFTQYLSNYLNERSIVDLMEETKITGTLNIDRPSLYIFPAREGDCSFFALNGYSMLIDGGYDRTKPCFWQFASMLKQLDSILITHADADAMGGLSSFFAKKCAEPNVKPNVSSVFGNLLAGNSDADVILEACDKLKLVHAPLVKKEVMPVKPQHQPERVNLYYKHATGSLDMYVLSPFQNSNEYKEFLHHTTAKVNANVHKSQLNVNNTFKDIPITHLCSAVVLLTWTPHRANENILRMLFTGNAPQNVIASALEKVKEFDILKSAVCKVKGAVEPVVVKKQVASAAVKPTVQNGDKQANGVSNGSSSVAPKPSSAKPLVQNGKPVAKQSVASANGAASNVVDGVVTSKKVEKKEPSAPVKKTSSENAETVKTAVTKAVAKKDEPKSTAASVKPVATKMEKKVSTTNTAAAATAAPVSKPKPAAKPTSASAAAASAKPEVEKKDAVKSRSSAVAPKSAPVKTNSKATAAKTTVTKPSAVVPTGDQLQTRLVAEITPAASAASALSTVETASVDETTKAKPSFLGSIKNAWDGTFGRKKSSTPTEEQPPQQQQQQLVQDQSPEQIEVEDVFEQQNQEQAEQIAEVFDNNRDENCEVSRREDAEVVGSSGIAAVDSQQVDKMQTSEEAEYEESGEEQGQEYNNHEQQEEEDLIPAVENENFDEVTPQSEASSSEQQQNVIDDTAEEIDHVQGEQQQLSDEGIEEDQSPVQHQQLVEQQQQQQYNDEQIETANIDAIENIENDERDVIDPTEVIDNSPHLSPVKCNGSKTSMDMDENIDEIVEIIHSDVIDQQPGLHLDLAQQQAVVVVEDVRDLIESPQDGNTPHDEEIAEFKQQHPTVDDVMTRSFIDDGESKNPFVQQEQPVENVDVKEFKIDDLINNLKSMSIEPVAVNGEGEGKENNYTNGHHHQNGHTEQQTSSADPSDPSTWNLLELPKPVNPSHTDADSASASAADPSSPTKQQQPMKKQQPTESKPNKPATLNSSFSNKAIRQSTSNGQNQKPVHPYYFDVSYVPAHGNQYYVDSDFFRRVRARYYVLSTIEPSEHVLNALIDGKQTWEDKDLPVSLIPTYETDTLKNWYMLNSEKLAALKIDISAAAIHTTLTIDNNPDIAYQVHKLEF